MKLADYWYKPTLHPRLFFLLPFSLLFRGIVRIRRLLYDLGMIKIYQSATPIVVVGNITAGGTGKTPFVIWLAQMLKEQGKNPGIVARGVGGRKKRQPTLVTAEANPFEVGDEAVLLAQQTHCPVVVGVNRPAAVKKLLTMGCDVIISDDGLQHYKLARSLEIAIVDSSRYFGNGFLLPAGPLREPISRLNKVDFIVINQTSTSFGPELHFRGSQQTFPMQLHADTFVSVKDAAKQAAISTFSGKVVHAVAGIGNPQRFFNLLRHLNIHLQTHIFPDHHPYQVSDFDFHDTLPILMTEKDAIKCKQTKFLNELKERQWFLRVKTEVSPELKQALLSAIIGETHAETCNS